MDNLSLIQAVRAGDYEEAKKLIASGIDVNQQDEHGWTALNFAAGKGNLALVRLLVDGGGDVFKVGRDRRTPYMIALAAGRIEVIKYLKEVEDNYPGDKPIRPQRQYCKAYHLSELRRYSSWSEQRIKWKKRKDESSDASFTDDTIVFIHQDFTVTSSMWHDENVIFQSAASDWKTFCVDTLNFRVPDDLDLVTAAEATT